MPNHVMKPEHQKIADLESKFRSAPYMALRAIHCEISDDSLVLTGHVPSYYLKQLAQSHVAAILPKVRVVNRIEVAST